MNPKVPEQFFFLFYSILFKGEADQVFYSSQDGERLEENVVESIQKEAQSLLDNLDEKIDENDSNQSIGIK